MFVDPEPSPRNVPEPEKPQAEQQERDSGNPVDAVEPSGPEAESRCYDDGDFRRW
ncbi:hypothetical protein [Actinoplanes utahensis]|uniref:hypothetical protein n=1 Tax=Actinoplanes utahensis TaxID=1869 RepID=UPI000A4BE0A3|nr:hypothetical protein [Actinoplanes utahensis]GIF32652.1 hypothetical protein Aut01nite_56380 [Actinoplanes utahensis]